MKVELYLDVFGWEPREWRWIAFSHPTMPPPVGCKRYRITVELPEPKGHVDYGPVKAEPTE